MRSTGASRPRWPDAGHVRMEIRRLTADDDHRSIGLLVQRAYLELPGYRPDAEYDVVVADVAGRHAEGSDVVVAVDHGRVVGCLTFVRGPGDPHYEFGDPDAASFRYFGVDQTAQGSGVGRAMVEWCIEEARMLGRRRIRIHSLESMVAARRLYERIGFVRTPDHDETWDGVLGLAFALELDRPARLAACEPSCCVRKVDPRS